MNITESKWHFIIQPFPPKDTRFYYWLFWLNSRMGQWNSASESKQSNLDQSFHEQRPSYNPQKVLQEHSALYFPAVHKILSCIITAPKVASLQLDVDNIKVYKEQMNANSGCPLLEVSKCTGHIVLGEDVFWNIARMWKAMSFSPEKMSHPAVLAKK